MAEKKETVTLIAPNGQTVSVAASKKDLRIAAGYRLPEPEKRGPGRPKSSSD
ncbi:hypothetical protein SEA_SQUIDDLY_9 [Gordonia phage Squiddly]|uniref:Uncharacterized protein n=1 Tax=Gordonia phage Phistory TaxID=2301694 RepID=A0A385DYV0_9CAUD|nr:hypothetical protein HOT94_gp008 [Gordonia phage Phistory]AXQ64713.1 hypothetical protein SEA_PHISTORY_8 [Gordonia phage Phistory]QDK02762.1 hypothetical protein SEA_SQUIDDLY_9 [Gordonia phage Squiddly]